MKAMGLKQKERAERKCETGIQDSCVLFLASGGEWDLCLEQKERIQIRASTPKETFYLPLHNAHSPERKSLSSAALYRAHKKLSSLHQQDIEIKTQKKQRGDLEGGHRPAIPRNHIENEL